MAVRVLFALIIAVLRQVFALALALEETAAVVTLMVQQHSLCHTPIAAGTIALAQECVVLIWFVRLSNNAAILVAISVANLLDNLVALAQALAQALALAVNPAFTLQKSVVLMQEALGVVHRRRTVYLEGVF